MQVTIVFAPTIAGPEGPTHEQVFYEGGVKDVEYPQPGAAGLLVVRFDDGTRAVFNWLHVREVLEDPVGKVRPNRLAVV